MVKKLKAAWWRLPSWLRAAINTSWATFLAAVTMPVLGWLLSGFPWLAIGYAQSPPWTWQPGAPRIAHSPSPRSQSHQRGR